MVTNLRWENRNGLRFKFNILVAIKKIIYEAGNFE